MKGCAIIGHGRILSFFSQAIAANRLSHAYCFVGSSHVGRRTVAEDISARLLTIDRNRLASHPDMMVVAPAVDEDTGKRKKDISVEQIGSLRSTLSKHAFLGGYTCAVIDQADRLNAASANALLKTLEEPREKTVLFLIVEDDGALPETIISRCQRIFFQPVSKSEIADGLISRDIPEDRARLLSEHAIGLPGLAIHWTEDEADFGHHVAETKRFEELFGKPFFEKLEMVDPLFGDKSDPGTTRDFLRETLTIWQTTLRRIILESQSHLDREMLLTVEEKIREAKYWLLRNIHPRLLVEQILLAIP